MRLQTVQLDLPAFKQWAYRLENSLDLAPGEDAHSVKVTGPIEIPGVLVLDFVQVAGRAGWSLGQLLSFLVMQGAQRVVEKNGQVL